MDGDAVNKAVGSEAIPGVVAVPEAARDRAAICTVTHPGHVLGTGG